MNESGLEALKRVARENEALRRFELEGSPALSPSDVAIRAGNLRSFDDLSKAYRDMRHADFCEAVALAIRAGNVSDTSPALYIREWVRCGAAGRTSFPEWLEGEGRARVLVLNEEWLSSGIARHTSFDEWWVSQPGPKPTNVWGKVSNLYEVNDAAALRGLLVSIHTTIFDAKKHPEDLAYYASFVCGVAVTLREILGIDVNTLTLIVEPPPLPSAHPLVKIFDVLDYTAKETIGFLAKADKDDPRLIDAKAMMQAALIWKGYLLALNSYPDSWEAEAVCALAILKILTTVDGASVLNSLRNEVHAVRGNFNENIRAVARDSDWPPRGFIDLYRKNSGILETKCSALFGASSNPA
jgi:hypothetical protein